MDDLEPALGNICRMSTGSGASFSPGHGLASSSEDEEQPSSSQGHRSGLTAISQARRGHMFNGGIRRGRKVRVNISGKYK